MRRFLIICLLVSPALISCSITEHSIPTKIVASSNLYLDPYFPKNQAQHIESEQEIFQLDDDMRAMVKDKLLNKRNASDKVTTLLKQIFNEENIALSYRSNANLTAREAYHSRIANCMSLTVLAYALAIESDLNVQFQQIDVPEYWLRNGQYNQLTGHINLLVQNDINTNATLVWGRNAMEIDFDPYVAKKAFFKKTISKNRVLAIFYNNKAADALVKSDYNLAYHYLKAATHSDSRFSSAWGNLGVLYRLTGHQDKAEEVYRHALSLNTNNLTALANLALLLHRKSQHTDALAIEAYLKTMREKNPYYHAVLGEEALYNNLYNQAESHYKKAIFLDKSEHEFYFSLAKVYYHQGKVTAAKRVMKMAIHLNKSAAIDKLYAAKLNVLKQTKID